MNFFNILKSSIYSPKFYSGISKESLSQPLKYFFLLILTLTVIDLLPKTPILIITFPQGVKSFINQTLGYFPQDLEVTINKGKASTNVKEPYFLTMPKDGDNPISKDDLNNLLVIDTKTPYSTSQFDQYKTEAWLTQDTLFYRDQSQIKTYSLAQIQDFKVNKSLVQEVVNKFLPWTNILGPVLLILAFFGLYFLYTLNLFYFLVLALLVWIFSKIFKWDLTYGGSYKVVIYAATLAFIVDLVLRLTENYTHISAFPWLFTIITLGVVFSNFWKLKNQGSKSAEK